MASVIVTRRDELDHPDDAGRKIPRYAGLSVAHARAVAHDLYETGRFRRVVVKSDAGGSIEIFPQPMA
jgi:hypothetical protein